MTYEDYIAQRNSLYDEASALIDEGDFDGSEAKQQEMQDLDAQWERTMTASANLQAMSGAIPRVDPSMPTATAPTGGHSVDNTDVAPVMNDPEAILASEEYKTAWAKAMMRRSLTSEEERLGRVVNEAYVHTTTNTPQVIPTNVANGIWQEVEDQYPYFADITKTYVKGLLTIIKSDTSTDAGWYTEDEETEDGKETFTTVTLSGCELSRSITVSWKLQEMSIAEFLPYIQSRIAEKMGKALGYGVTHGTGADAEKPEPLGIITGMTANAPDQIVTYESGKLSYTDVTAARGKIKSGYATGLAMYANSTTIWGELANLLDNNGRPIFVPDPTGQGVYRIFGLVVKEDGSLSDGEILISNARQYQANINRNISVETEDHVKARNTDYAAYAIVDGTPLTYYAHALLTTSDTATASVKTASTKSSK